MLNSSVNSTRHLAQECERKFMLLAPQSKAERQLQQYIIDSCTGKMQVLIPFISTNATTTELAKYLLRYRSGSKGTLYLYGYGIWRFCNWVNIQPDQMIQSCKDEDGDPNPKAIAKYNRLLDDYVGELQADDLTNGAIKALIKGVKSLFRSNGLRLDLPSTLPNRPAYKIRSPTPEELIRILDVADLREKVITSALATGGFREGTLSKLLYRHVKEDLEANMIPLHIHVEAEITKGKYHDYDTFLGQEAVTYLKLYLQMRRKGTTKIPPENINDESPLIRSAKIRKPLPSSPATIYNAVHKLYLKAGLISADSLIGRRYDLCAHSIRKYFKTTLTALKVQDDYVEYMMGHTISTYDDIQMKGTEFLRGIYVASGLCIRPKTRVSKIEALKEIMRAWGLNPDEVLTKDALSKSNATIIDQEQIENSQLHQLHAALKRQMIEEIRVEKHE